MSAKKKTILLIEDEQTVLLDTSNRLKALGYRIVTAGGIDAAIKIIDSGRTIDLVLMDIAFGLGINGTNAADAIMSRRPVPLVFLTDAAERRIADKVRSIARYGYVGRDSDDSALLSSLEMACKLFEAHEKIRDSEERYRHIFLNAVEGIFRSSPEGIYLDVNPAFAEILGYGSPEELMGGITDIGAQIYVNPSRRLEITELLSRYGSVKNFEAELYRRDGSVILVSIYATAVRDTAGKISHYQGSMIDITARRRIEKEIKGNEERFRQILTSVPAVVYSGDFIGKKDEIFKTTYISESLKDLLGYDPEELLGNMDLWMELIHPDDMKDLVGSLNTLLEQGTVKVEYRFRHIDGSFRWIHDEPRILYDSQGNPKSVIGAWIDITERKSLMEELRRRENRLSEQSKALSCLIIEGGWFGKDLKDAIREITETGARFMETERASVWFYDDDFSHIRQFDLYELSKNLHSDGEVLESADFPEYTAAHRKGKVIAADDVFSDERTSSIPHEYYNASGITSLLDAPVWHQGRLRALLSFEHSGERRHWLPEEEQMAITLAAYISLCLEAHERTLMERKALEGEEKFSRIFMMSPDAITITTLPDGKFVEVNDVFIRIMGYSREEAIGKSAEELNLWVNKEEQEGVFKSIKEWGHYADHEIHFQSKQGLIFVGLSSGRVIEIGGMPYLLTVNRDITMRKAIEQALRESEKKFRLLFQSVPIGIMRYDNNLIIQECNESFVKLLHSERNRLIGLEIRKLNDARILECVSKILKGENGYYEGNYKATTSDMDVYITVHTVPIWDAEGAVIGGIVIVQDTTERKRAELAIRISEENLRNIFNSVQDAILIHDLEGNILEINEAALVMYRTVRDTALRCTIGDFYSPEFSMQNLRDSWRTMKYGDISRFEAMARRPVDGSLFDVDVILCRTIHGDKEVILASVRDITESKKAAEQIKKLLEEKDLLLREVHHRIKNNMLTISSLLSLQADTLSDGSARAALLDSGSRIQSMMHIYDKLYRSKDYSNINISMYLSALIDDIITTYSIEPRRITIEKSIEEINVTTRIAFPVGLMVNELVSNALKYAFPENRNGELHVNLRRLDGNRIELSVSDNGIGVPETVNVSDPKSFGLSLVNLLVRQVQGELNLSTGEGTCFTIVFAV